MNQKTNVLFVLIMMIIISSLSATNFEISGHIDADTTWSGVDTIKVTGDIYVDNGITLTIDHGIYVEFQADYQLDIDGRLLSQGIESDIITFTPINHSMGWNRIVFDNTSTSNDSSKIEYCKLEYGKANSSGEGEYGGAIYVNNFDKLMISHCEFSNNSADMRGGAIYCNNSDIKIEYCNIKNNESDYYGGGLYLQYSNLQIINCLISNNTSYFNGGGILFFNSSCNNLINNTITGNSVSGFGGGIFSLTNFSQILGLCLSFFEMK